MTSVTVKFRLAKETKGAVLYNEIDRDGEPTPYGYQRVGGQYLKKRMFGDESRTKFPKLMIATFEWDEGE